jgi:hypothetical protein
MDLNLLQLHGDVGGKKPKGDAVEGDVRSGKTFSNADELGLTGTIPVRASAAQSITPGTSNIVKAAGIYDGDITILGDPDLVAANIKSGANLFGVGGKTEVVDTTTAAGAAAGDVLSGKEAFINGSKVTGNIPSKGAETITPGTTNKTIAAGQYLSGIQTIAGDGDLVAGNILSGKNIFGVAGNVVPGKPMATGTQRVAKDEVISPRGLTFAPYRILFYQYTNYNYSYWRWLAGALTKEGDVAYGTSTQYFDDGVQGGYYYAGGAHDSEVMKRDTTYSGITWLADGFDLYIKLIHSSANQDIKWIAFGE